VSTETAYIALGSNLGRPLAQLRFALMKLRELGEVSARSSLYKSPAQGGPAGQPDYLNAVVTLAPFPAYHEPLKLLGALLAVEREAGRVRRIRWEARTLDLDLLALGERVVESPNLTLPHPRMMERAFVLAPLCEIAPSWRHPRDARRACDALATLDTSALERTGLEWE
jgi:2-amino-4-hydroxy-6-hydroxymethyldihydropteridine diphosphokinase